MLVLCAILLVGLFGLLGAVVDGGRLRTTKQQMDAGAESAALEGLRFKDRVDDEGLYTPDEHRRLRAVTALQRQWDDDLDLTSDALGLGAGTLPVVEPGIDTPLGGRINVPVDRRALGWRPADAMLPGPQHNAVNARHGDLVAGAYVEGAGVAVEDDAFNRTDFAPVAAGSGGEVLAAAPAFLVRLRRAGSRLALDEQPGESTKGDPFEWLWARGIVWHEPTAEAPGIASRTDGVTVRATSIAAATRALLVADAPDGSVTIAPFALVGDVTAAWAATGVGAGLDLQIDPSGSLILAGEQGVWLGVPARLVGDEIVPTPPGEVLPPTGDLIVPVYGRGDVRRVAGFTLASATRSGTTLTIVRRRGAVLPTGASAVAPAALDARLVLSASPGLLALHNAFPQPVLAPVLRH
ncbi:MAG: pilus assembly protein TadG-related protein [Planctomycetota bacterium]